MIRSQVVAPLLVFLLSTPAFADRVVRAEIRAAPDGESTEYGLIYSNTGLIPASLDLYCQSFEDEPTWDGTSPQEPAVCGHLDLRIRLSSLGLSAFLMNFSKAHPLTVRLLVNPETATLRSVLGTYVGAKAGVGVATGALTMVLRNEESGDWAMMGQTMDTRDDRSYGVDLSVPWLQVYSVTSEKPEDMQRTLASLLPASG